MHGDRCTGTLGFNSRHCCCVTVSIPTAASTTCCPSSLDQQQSARNGRQDLKEAALCMSEVAHVSQSQAGQKLSAHLFLDKPTPASTSTLNLLCLTHDQIFSSPDPNPTHFFLFLSLKFLLLKLSLSGELIHFHFFPPVFHPLKPWVYPNQMYVVND